MLFPQDERGYKQRPSQVQGPAPGQEHTGQEGVRKSSLLEETGYVVEPSHPQPEAHLEGPARELHSTQAGERRTVEAEHTNSAQGVVGSWSVHSCCCSGCRLIFPSCRHRWWGLRVHPYCALPGTAEEACTVSLCGDHPQHRTGFARCYFSDKEKHPIQSSTCTSPNVRLCKHSAMRCCRSGPLIPPERLFNTQKEQSLKNVNQLI